VNLETKLHPLPVFVEIDRFHFERALINLVSNAIEASGKGQGVKIGITVGRDTLTIAAKDLGLGMDNRDTRENIFTPFFTNKKHGSGLGMPIVKKIIEAHKGKIYVFSNPGGGTDAKVELPYKVIQ